MRQRKIKNEEEKVLEYKKYLEIEPKERKGNWSEKFTNKQPIKVEIGCGRGQFISNMAEKNLDINYIAIESQGSIIIRALQKAEENNQTNLQFIWINANTIEEFFQENEVSGIYLNFSDPWPKDRHAKRRITHENFLKQYARIMKNNGELNIKTDNKDLFDFTLEELKKSQFKITEQSFNLHHSEYLEGNIMTEYEERFIKENKKINYCKAILHK